MIQKPPLLPAFEGMTAPFYDYDTQKVGYGADESGACIIRIEPFPEKGVKEERDDGYL